jgi:hypothetical protein
MNMKMKYVGMLLTSLGLVTAVAAVPAQQDDPRPDKPASQDYYTPLAPVARPVAENDGDVLHEHRRSHYANLAYFQRDDGEHGKLAAAEAALAHEAEQLKRSLEQSKTDSKKSEIRTKLAENLGKQFDLRQKRHGLEIEALETQVKKLKELVRRRQESREDIISRRVDQLLREVDGLGW